MPLFCLFPFRQGKRALFCTTSIQKTGNIEKTQIILAFICNTETFNLGNIKFLRGSRFYQYFAYELCKHIQFTNRTNNWKHKANSTSLRFYKAVYKHNNLFCLYHDIACTTSWVCPKYKNTSKIFKKESSIYKFEWDAEKAYLTRLCIVMYCKLNFCSTALISYEKKSFQRTTTHVENKFWN